MYIDIVPNRNSPPAVLLRESLREGKKIRKRTLANLSSLSSQQVEMIRHVLKGEDLLPVENRFEIIASAHHGHVEAVLKAMKRLGFNDLISSTRSRERDLIVGAVVARILEPCSKLAMTRWWHTTTLPATMGISNADEDDVYAAMDWLLKRQDRIEKKLASRHLKEGGLAFFDLTSSYFEGVTCPLAAVGKNRDGKKGKLQVNYGVLTDQRGRPIAISVFKGNVGDPKTLMPQVVTVREKFGIKTLVLVGDRGMITQTRIDEIKGMEGLNWITALKSDGIEKLMEDKGPLQMELFDERNLFELTHLDYPGERFVACRNPELRKLRGHKRQSLIEATERELKKVQGMVGRGRLAGKGAIGVRVGKVVNKYKVGKHFVLDIEDHRFDFHLDKEKVAAEAALDGVYVIRTSLKEEQSSAEDTVRHYKTLSLIEQAYRSIKTIALNVRPIGHYAERRVRSHILVCTLAYYVLWHMREAWRELLFCDEDQEAKKTRDPVAPAERSEAALKKIRSKVLEDGSEAHSFQTLLKLLSTIVRNRCRIPGTGPETPTFEIVTTPDAKQQRAYALLEKIEIV